MNELLRIDHVAYECKDVTTRGEYYPNKSMATAAVSDVSCKMLIIDLVLTWVNRCLHFTYT